MKRYTLGFIYVFFLLPLAQHTASVSSCTVRAAVLGYVHTGKSSPWQWLSQGCWLHAMGTTQRGPIPLPNTWAWTEWNTTLLTAAWAEPEKCLQLLSIGTSALIACSLPGTVLVPDKLSLCTRDCGRLRVDGYLHPNRHQGGSWHAPGKSGTPGGRLLHPPGFALLTVTNSSPKLEHQDCCWYMHFQQDSQALFFVSFQLQYFYINSCLPCVPFIRLFSTPCFMRLASSCPHAHLRARWVATTKLTKLWMG